MASKLFHTYHHGQFEQTETTYLDPECEKTFQGLNRFASFEILPSSDEESGELRLAIKTERIIDFVNDEFDPTIPSISCNREQADDFKKEECKAYLGLKRYVTVKLTPDGYLPFKDIDTAGTTEETISTEFSPYTLRVLDAND